MVHFVDVANMILQVCVCGGGVWQLEAGPSDVREVLEVRATGISWTERKKC